MSRKLPSGITSRVNDSSGKSRKQYRASISDPSQRQASGRLKRISSRWFDTLTEAKDWMVEQVTALKTVGTLQSDRRLTVSEAVTDWVSIAETVGIGGRKPVEDATAERYRSSARTVIEPSIGVLRLAELKAPQVIRWRDNMVRQHGNDAARRALAVLKQVTAYHVTIAAIPTDPAASVTLAKSAGHVDEDEEGQPDEFMSPDDARRILDAADRLADTGIMKSDESRRGLGQYQLDQRKIAWRRTRPLVYLLILGGPRMGEAAALRWGDVNWEDQTIRIERARKRSGKVGAPKNRSSVRTIKMGAKFMAILRELYVAKNDRAAGDYVFSGVPNRPLNANGFGRRQWCDLVDEAGMLLEDGGNRWTPHDCRHYHASTLIMSGVNVQLVADRLGHANSNVTMSVYAHLFKELAGKANTAGADLEDALIGR